MYIYIYMQIFPTKSLGFRTDLANFLHLKMKGGRLVIGVTIQDLRFLGLKGLGSRVQGLKV